jgi:hypothetical protein
MHRSARHHPRVEFDLAECAFVAPDVLLKDAEESLRLLRAQVDALEVLDFNLGLALLQQSSEDEEKIPHIHPYLHAIGIVLAIVARIRQLHIGLNWVGHKDASVAGLPPWKEVGRPFGS